MANLLESIRNAQQPNKMGLSDESARVAQLLRAKSGRAVSGPAVAASNLGEQQTVASTNQQLQNEVQPQLQLQNEAAKQTASGIAQQERLERQDIQQARNFDDVKTNLEIDSVLRDLERNKGELDTKSYQARLDQVAQNLRLQNQQYVDNLEREGAKQRLNSEIGFREALQRDVFEGNLDLLRDRLGAESALADDDRTFKMKMANMDVNTAWDLFKTDMAADRQRAVWTGVGNLASAGAGAWGAYDKYQEKKAEKAGQKK